MQQDFKIYLEVAKYALKSYYGIENWPFTLMMVNYGQQNYKDGKKFCRRCEIFLFHLGIFCPWCGMALRKSPTGREQKEKLRMNQSNSLTK
jgi:hypothetical protein